MFPWNTALMLCLVKLLPVPVIVFFRSRRDLLLENFALRQQLAVLKRRDPRPRMAVSDRLFWVLLRRSRRGSSRIRIISSDSATVCPRPSSPTGSAPIADYSRLPTSASRTAPQSVATATCSATPSPSRCFWPACPSIITSWFPAMTTLYRWGCVLSQ